MNQFDYEIHKNDIAKGYWGTASLKQALHKFIKNSKQGFKLVYYPNPSSTTLGQIKSRGYNYKLFKQARELLMKSPRGIKQDDPTYIKDTVHYVNVKMSFEDAYKLFTGKEL